MKLHEKLDMTLKVRGEARSGNGLLLKSCADWVLEWKDGEEDEITMLVVNEAKHGPIIAGLPELLVQMAVAQDIKKQKNHPDQTVLGMTHQDGSIFKFAILDHQGTFSTSRTFNWYDESAIILNFINNILERVIHSHSQPALVTCKKRNVLQYSPFIKEGSNMMATSTRTIAKAKKKTKQKTTKAEKRKRESDLQSDGETVDAKRRLVLPIRVAVPTTNFEGTAQIPHGRDGDDLSPSPDVS